MWDQQAEDDNQKMLKSPFSEEEADKSIENVARYNFDSYTEHEMDELTNFADKARDLMRYVNDH